MSYNIKDLIPHRDPMLLVEEIVSVEPFNNIHTRITLPEGHNVFAGHFPGNPILPGMLSIEMLAQAAACLAGISLERKQEDTLYYFLNVEKAKFRQMVRPNETIDVHVVAQKIRGKLCRFEGKAYRGDELVVEATFTAMIDDRKKD